MAKDVSTSKTGEKTRVIVDLILLVIGIILIAAPNVTMTVITILAGVALLAYGVISLITAIKKKNDANLVIPLICIIAGVLVLVFNNFFADIALPLVMGIWVLLMGIVEIIDVRRNNGSAFNTILAIASIIIGAIILIGIIVGHNTMGMLLGVCLVVYGAVSLINWLYTMVRNR